MWRKKGELVEIEKVKPAPEPEPYEIPWPDRCEIGFVEKKAVIVLMDGTVEEYDILKLNGDGTVTCIEVEFQSVNVGIEERHQRTLKRRYGPEWVKYTSSYSPWWGDKRHMRELAVKTYGHGAWKSVTPGAVTVKTTWVEYGGEWKR